MQKFTLGVFVAAVFIAAALPADVILRGHDAPPLDAPRVTADAERPSLSQRALKASGIKGEPPPFFYVLPIIKIRESVADGDFTLLAMRNEASTASTIAVDFFSPDGIGPFGTLNNALLPNEVWTLNLRAAMTGLSAGPDGLVRGFAFITSNEPFTTDYFQLDPANDFAAGSRPAIINGSPAGNDFCRQATARFLVGGGFTGGTSFFFLLDLPLGGDPDNDPPSIRGEVFDESGNMVDTFSIFTENFVLEVDAADLIPQGVNFGSITFSFDSDGGGFLQAEYKANNRFSVSVTGACLDTFAE